MSDNDNRSTAPAVEVPVERRIAFERLRERTDELELIISGLTVFALFALPDLLLSVWLRTQVHVEGGLVEGLQTTFMFATGLSYALGLAFVAHLAVRAYWVGLIGLKAAFPHGVRWDATPTLGPVGRDYFRRRFPDIDTAIDRADRVASIIFALASLVAILIVWIGIIVGLTIAVSALVTTATGMSDSLANALLLGTLAMLMAMSLFNWIADRHVIGRDPSPNAHPILRRWLARSLRINNAIIPQRLVLPVQLTLQSNLPPRRFMVVFAFAIALIPLIGSAMVLTRVHFAPLNSYEFFDDAAAETAMRSAYYESLRSDGDSALHLPSIASDHIADSYLRVFLPHLPSRDNPVLRARCPTERGDTAGLAAVSACLALPWRVRIDGVDQPLADFVPTERRDLGLRGLQGYVPLQGFLPGRHDLVVHWNESGPETGNERRQQYHIPFWFAPSYEMALDVPDAAAGPDR